MLGDFRDGMPDVAHTDSQDGLGTESELDGLDLTLTESTTDLEVVDTLVAG